MVLYASHPQRHYKAKELQYSFYFVIENNRRPLFTIQSDMKTTNTHHHTFLYVKAPRGGERPDRPRRPEKFGRPIAIRWLRMKENLAISEYKIKSIYKTFYMDEL